MRRRRARRAARALGLRQVHAAAHREPARAARLRARHRSTATDVAELDPVELRRSIGYVIQAVGLFAHMTVAQNVAVVPSLLGWTRDGDRRARRRAAALVGLDPAALSRPPPEPTFGRRGAARRRRARDRCAAARAADGRAVRRRRRARSHRAAARARAHRRASCRRRRSS